MSCYFRHLKELFDEAGIEVSTANRKQVDQAIHQIVNVPYKECPQAWKKIQTGDNKQRSKAERVCDQVAYSHELNTLPSCEFSSTLALKTSIKPCVIIERPF